MGVNFDAQAGSGQIDVFEITSNYSGETVDIRQGVVHLHIYESIFDSTVRADVSYMDTGYGITKALSEDGFNNSGGEKTSLVVRDGKDRKITFKGNNQLRTSDNNREAFNTHDTNKVSVFTSFYSKESMDNHLLSSRTTRKYERKISDNVVKILKEDLGTPKNVYVDPSKNDFNFLGGNEKPFHKVTWLCKRTVPDGFSGNGILAGYLFYEIADGAGTPGGYYFKSVDVLFGQNPVRRFILSNTNQIPPGYDGKILNHKEFSSIDVDDHLISGSLFQRQMETFEPFNNNYKKDDFDYKKQNLVSNNGGKEFWKIATDLNYQDNVTRYSSKFFDTGVLPTGRNWNQQKKESKQINLEIDEIIRQSTNRYNQMSSVNLNIIIPMDLGIHVGDMIFVDFPEIASNKVQRPSKNKSGNYLIIDLCHKIGSAGCYSSVHLVRDSIYRKSK